MIGKAVTHYRVLEKIGGGGMGVVYKAEDLKLRRTVALKFLPPEATRDEEAKRRFLHEAQAVAVLDHPNICTVYEIDETPEGDIFLAMACYEGETLRQRITRGPLPVPESVRIAAQICDGLSRAHQQGIIHRDIKPANIMLSSDGTVKILDFGLAKLAGQTTLTQSGAAVGTVAYMSPEQARGLTVDPRTDLWALGAVLYEMVTGRPPFAGEYAQAVIYSILNETPDPPSALRPELPPALERVIGRALSRDPGRRYADAAEMADDLRAVAAGSASGPASREASRPPIPPAGPSDTLPLAAGGGEAAIESAERRRPPWWLYLAASPFICYMLVVFYLNFFGVEQVGLKWIPEKDRLRIVEVWGESAAEAAGFQEGDLIVAVDGRPATPAVMRLLYYHAGTGRAYSIDLIRQGAHRTATLMFQRVSWRYWGTQPGLIDLMNLFVGLVFFGLALCIAFTHAHDPLALLGALWMTVWGIPFSWILAGPGPGFDRILGQMPIPLAILVLLAPTLSIGLSAELNVIFLSSFPRRVFRAPWIYILLWLATLPRTCVMGYDFFGSHLTLEPVVLPPLVLQVLSLLRLAYFLGAIGLVIWNYRTLEDLNQRRRMRLLVTGICLFFLLVTVHASLSIQIWEFQRSLIDLYWRTPVPLVVSMLIVASGILLAVAIVQHRVFGFGMMIRRSLQYAAARGLLLGLAPLCLAVFVVDLLFHADQPLAAILASRGWFYAALGIGGALAHFKQKAWQDALDRRFFRERYNAQQILAGVVQEISRAPSLEVVAPRVAAQVEAALHPLYAALLKREAGAQAFHVLVIAPKDGASGLAEPEAPEQLALQQAPMPAEGKLATLIRVLEKPIEVAESGTVWLWRQLPPRETAWLRHVRLEWLFPVILSPAGPEVLLALGPKRSEEPYSQEDQDLLAAVTAALALRVGNASKGTKLPFTWAPDQL